MKLAKTLAGFVKLEHTLFSLPLLFAGALLAGMGKTAGATGLFPRTALLIVLAGVGARSLALALNRIFDRALDARNPRTAGRELPAGKLSLGKAWAVALAGAVVYALAAWALGSWCLALAPIPVLVFAVYPLMKRFTALAHFGVGTGLALAPLGGWVATADAFPAQPAVWLLAGFTLCWVSGFDILYARQDLDFDRAAGLHSIPAALGPRAAGRIAAALHLAAFLSLALLAAGPLAAASWKAWLALAPAAALLAVEQRLGNSLEPGSAFFTVNAWIGFAVLGFIAACIIV